MFLKDHNDVEFNETVDLNGNDIAWDSDKDVKFKNPSCKWIFRGRNEVQSFALYMCDN